MAGFLVCLNGPTLAKIKWLCPSLVLVPKRKGMGFWLNFEHG